MWPHGSRGEGLPCPGWAGLGYKWCSQYAKVKPSLSSRHTLRPASLDPSGLAPRRHFQTVIPDVHGSPRLPRPGPPRTSRSTMPRHTPSHPGPSPPTFDYSGSATCDPPALRYSLPPLSECHPSRATPHAVSNNDNAVVLQVMCPKTATSRLEFSSLTANS